jgi:hypothetical protein
MSEVEIMGFIEVVKNEGGDVGEEDGGRSLYHPKCV